MNVTHEQYERLMLLIFFEVITIVFFIMFYGKLLSKFQYFVFWYLIIFFQMPFLSFIENDFLGRRPTLAEKITRFFIKILILIVIFGIFVIIFFIDFKSGIVSSLVALIFLIFQNLGKIETWLRRKKKK